MACPNCKSDAEPVKNFAGDVVGCESCFATIREWCEVSSHWVHDDDARTRYHHPRSEYDEGTASCVECEGD